MLAAIFERFSQVGQNDLKGVGLGLYISRCIVEAHGGKIWAESEPEEGSTDDPVLQRFQFVVTILMSPTQLPAAEQ